MAKIKTLSVKLSNGSFSAPYSIGVDSQNVEFQDGKNLDEKVLEINNDIENKAKKNHASATEEFGIGTEDSFGHLKISNEFKKTLNDPESTAMSQGAIKNFIEYLGIFQLLEEETLLFSSLNTAYFKIGERSTLNLISNYFEIQPNGSDYTLVIK